MSKHFYYSIIVGILVSVVANELTAWLSAISKVLLRINIYFVPEDLKARLAEEWEAHIDQVPGSFGKLIASVGMFLVSVYLSLESIKDKYVLGISSFLEQKIHSIPGPRDKIYRIIPDSNNRKIFYMAFCNEHIRDRCVKLNDYILVEDKSNFNFLGMGRDVISYKVIGKLHFSDASMFKVRKSIL